MSALGARLKAIRENPRYTCRKMVVVEKTNDFLWQGAPEEVRVYRGTAADIPRIMDIWPLEFSGMKNGLQEMLVKRFEAGLPCFLAEWNGELAGGVWCVPPKSGFLSDGYEISNIFINQQYRGKKIAQQLLAVSTAAMREERPDKRCYARIYTERVKSVAVFEQVGYDRIGTLLRCSLLTFEFELFITPKTIKFKHV